MQSEGIWIESTLFEPGPDEDAETNPGIFGKKFAEWIAETLQRSGYATEIVTEDWGWCVVCARKPFLLWVGCGNVAREPENIESISAPKGITWHCFAVAQVPFWKRLFGRIDPSTAISKLDAQLRASLSAEPGIELVAEP
jgi:hypothetical protein